MTTITLPRSAVYPGDPRTKRLFDISVVLILLPIAALIGAAIAVLVWLDSKGPIIHRQVRLGMDRRRREKRFVGHVRERRIRQNDGSPFIIYKFRTMKIDSEADGRPVWARIGDPRITRFGRFLRATHLDELPQLINVLKGEMSLVGPRPERPEIVEALKGKVPYYLNRLNAPAGLTGLAQIKHRADLSVDDVRIKIRYDRIYLRRQSLGLDTAILINTIPVALGLRFGGRWRP